MTLQNMTSLFLAWCDGQMLFQNDWSTISKPRLKIMVWIKSIPGGIQFISFGNQIWSGIGQPSFTRMFPIQKPRHGNPRQPMCNHNQSIMMLWIFIRPGFLIFPNFNLLVVHVLFHGCQLKWFYHVVLVFAWFLPRFSHGFPIVFSSCPVVFPCFPMVSVWTWRSSRQNVVSAFLSDFLCYGEEYIVSVRAGSADRWCLGAERGGTGKDDLQCDMCWICHGDVFVL